MTEREIDALEAGEAMDALIAEHVMNDITGPVVEIVGGKAVNQAGDSVILQPYSTTCDGVGQVIDNLVITRHLAVDISLTPGESWLFRNCEVVAQGQWRSESLSLPLAVCRVALKVVLAVTANERAE